MPELHASLQEKNLKRRLFIALATPLAILLVISTILGLQLSRLNRDARWVDHSDEVLTKLLEVQRQIIDQETGVRGFLLKEDPIFLEPYRQVHPLELIAELRQLVADNPTQLARVGSICDRYQSWHAEVAKILATRDRTGAATLEAMLGRKAQMDAVRAAITLMLDDEYALRRERKLASAQSVRVTWAVLVGLFVLEIGRAHV